MPLWDLNDLLEGLSYKGRQEWERIRTASYISIAPHCKKIDKETILNSIKEREEHISHANYSLLIT